MAQRTRYSNREGDADERPQRRAPAKSGPPIVPILALVVLLGGALVAARMIASMRDAGEQDTAVEPKGPPEPFSDLPEEVPTNRPHDAERRGPTAPVESAPPGVLAGDPVWRDALARATQAEILFQAASDAKAANDHELFREKGTAAKKMFSDLLEDTYLLEEELLAEYGDRDPQVREIVRKRTRWTNRLSTLSKTTGR